MGAMEGYTCRPMVCTLLSIHRNIFVYVYNNLFPLPVTAPPFRFSIEVWVWDPLGYDIILPIIPFIQHIVFTFLDIAGCKNVKC